MRESCGHAGLPPVTEEQRPAKQTISEAAEISRREFAAKPWRAAGEVATKPQGG